MTWEVHRKAFLYTNYVAPDRPHRPTGTPLDHDGTTRKYDSVTRSSYPRAVLKGRTAVLEGIMPEHWELASRKYAYLKSTDVLSIVVN